VLYFFSEKSFCISIKEVAFLNPKLKSKV